MQTVEIKNFLGFKMNKRIDAPEGVLITKKEEEKNNITLQSIDLEKVSQVCARIQQATVIQDKDLRSFLDGIYVQDARLEYNDWFIHIFKLFSTLHLPIYLYQCKSFLTVES